MVQARALAAQIVMAKLLWISAWAEGLCAAGGKASFSAAVVTLPAAKGQAGNSIGNSLILKSLYDFSINSLELMSFR